jgi:hypothetical protein
MNAVNLSMGIAMIIVGVVLFFAGSQLIVVPTTHVQVVELFHDETFAVSAFDVWEHSVQLDQGVTVNGTVAVSSALTGEPSEISMFVADDANYQKWVAHSSPTYAFQEDVSGGQGFSFTVPRTGLYHFVFNNANSPVKGTVTADLERQFTVNVPDRRIPYVAYGVLAVGFLVTAVGFLRKAPIRWA